MQNASWAKQSDVSTTPRALKDAIGQIENDQMLRTNTLTVPRRVVFGKDTAKNVGDEAGEFEAKRILVVTDLGVVQSGLLTGLMESFRTKDMRTETFSSVEPEPDITTANRIAHFVRGAEFDLVCGVGGGSAMDIAKIASIMATNPGDTKQYVGVGLVKKPGLPKILLPTTAGTGSEMTPNAIIGLHDEGTKVGIVSRHVMADTTIVDPTLTLTLPPKPTASSGIDALTHAIESYISVDGNPITDLLSLRAIELIARNLRTAYSNGSDLKARSAMSLASMMAGISIASAGTCSGHAAAYGYAAKHSIPHGFSVGVALPYILDFSLPSCLDKAGAIAEAMGEDTSRLNSSGTVARAVRSVFRLMKEIECPTALSELGISKGEILSIAKDMMKTKRLLIHNPRPLNEPDAIQIITKMWEGKISSD